MTEALPASDMSVIRKAKKRHRMSNILSVSDMSVIRKAKDQQSHPEAMSFVRKLLEEVDRLQSRIDHMELMQRSRGLDSW